MLVRHYLRRFSRELGRDVTRGRPARRWSGCGDHSWPGNIRELQSVLKQALLRASGTVLLPAFLPEPLGDLDGQGRSSPPPAEDSGLLAFIRERLGPDANDLYGERTDRSTGSSWPRCSSTPTAISTGRHGCWGSPARPCD